MAQSSKNRPHDGVNALERKDAFAGALALLNPKENPVITSQFTELIGDQSLLFIDFARATFPPVSKNELITTASAVASISKTLRFGNFRFRLMKPRVYQV